MTFLIINILCVLLIVAVHEYGHLFFARRYGIIPENFSIGFGYELWSFNSKGTKFSLRSIPLGGYVRFASEDENLDSLTKRQKILVALGGPIANLVLCLIVATIATSIGMMPFGLEEKPFIINLIIALIGTIIIFVVAIPLTIYSLFALLLNPIANMNEVAGPIGILSGDAIPVESFEGFGFIGQAIVTIWLISLALGTFNLVPLSILDGGRIFREVLSNYPRFINIWNTSSNALLVVLIVYLIGTDIFKTIVN